MVWLLKLIMCVILAACVALTFPDWPFWQRALVYTALAVVLLWATRDEG